MHALLFDLDGTLVDTVYAHVLAWQRALDEVGVAVDGYRLHRHVGSLPCGRKNEAEQPNKPTELPPHYTTPGPQGPPIWP